MSNSRHLILPGPDCPPTSSTSKTPSFPVVMRPSANSASSWYYAARSRIGGRRKAATTRCIACSPSWSWPLYQASCVANATWQPSPPSSPSSNFARWAATANAAAEETIHRKAPPSVCSPSSMPKPSAVPTSAPWWKSPVVARATSSRQLGGGDLRGRDEANAQGPVVTRIGVTGGGLRLIYGAFGA